jgi:hypothetical protein
MTGKKIAYKVRVAKQDLDIATGRRVGESMSESRDDWRGKEQKVFFIFLHN